MCLLTFFPLTFFPVLNFGTSHSPNAQTLKEPCQVEVVLPIQAVDSLACYLRRNSTARTPARSYPPELLEGYSSQTGLPMLAFRDRFPTYPWIHCAGAFCSSENSLFHQGSRSEL